MLFLEHPKSAGRALVNKNRTQRHCCQSIRLGLRFWRSALAWALSGISAMFEFVLCLPGWQFFRVYSPNDVFGHFNLDLTLMYLHIHVNNTLKPAGGCAA